MKKLFILFIVPLFMAGCYNEQESMIDSSNDSSFTLGMITLENAMTKTTNTVTSGTVDLSSLDATGAITASKQYTYSNSKWSIVSGYNLTAPAGTNLCAYYPYKSAITDRKAIPLTSGLYSAANDLCYGYATTTQLGTGSSTTASFALKRAYALLTFNFTCGSTVPSFNTISSLTIANAGIATTNTLDITSAAGTYGTATKASVTVNPGVTISANTTQSVALLMIPTDALVSTGNLVVTLTGGSPSTTKTMNIPVSSFPNNKLEAGKNYTFNVNLNQPVIIVSLPESNCYMVKPGSTVYIPVSRAVAGNAAIGYVATGGGTTAFSTGDAFTTGVLWSDAVITDRTATVSGQNIMVTAGATEGNFVVYAKKGSSIVWSWHIWVSNYIPSATAKPGIPTVTSGTGTIPYYGSQYWMDRNLGATTCTGNTQTSLGLYYQWGRKDPFPAASGVTSTTAQTIYLPQNITYPTGSTSITGFNSNVVYRGVTSPVTLANQSSYSIQYPLLFITSNWAGSTASAAADATTAAGGIYSWNSSSNTKSLFDPCPVGWRIPTSASYATSPWNSFGTSGIAYTGAAWNGSLRGISVTSPAAAATFYPASGSMGLGNGTLGNVGSNGWIWSCSIYSGVFCSDLDFSSSYIFVFEGNTRSNGFTARCVQE